MNTSSTPSYKPTILIIDGAHALRRSMYQPNLRTLSTSRGVPSGAIYGFLTSLKAAINSMRSDSVVVCWEGGHSDRRKQVYTEYKDRGPVDPSAPVEVDDFNMTDLDYYLHQMSWIQRILEELGVPQLMVKGKEGDDTLFQVTRILKGNKIIISEDKDFFTLIAEDISVFRPIKKEYVELGGFQKITNYATPKHFLYAKAILGDGSDNIPSVAKGVGEKTAWDILDRIKDPAELSPARVLKEAAFFNTSRHNKLIAAGESTINRNLDLIDIEREKFTIFELQALLDTLDKHVYPNVEMAKKILRSLEFSPENVDYITERLATMSTYPLTSLVDKDYLKRIMMGETSAIQG